MGGTIRPQPITPDTMRRGRVGTMNDNVTKLQDQKQQADHARNLLNDTQFKAAMATVEKQYIDAMLTANEKDDLGRFRYAEAIKVVRLVSRHLQTVVNSGKLSQAELTAMEGKKRGFF